MKKNLLAFVIVFGILFSTINKIKAQTVILSENFSGLTVSAGTTDISSTLNTKLQTTGWTGSKIYENAGNAKLGSSSAIGFITTKTINIAGNSGNATVKLDIAKYGTDANVIKILHAPDGLNFIQIGTNITLTTAFATITINFAGGTANSKL